MTIKAKVKDPGSVVVEIAIEMPMSEWEYWSARLEKLEFTEELRNKIWDIQRALEGVVRAEAVGDE